MPISTHPGPPGGAQGPPMSLVRHSTRETAHCPPHCQLSWAESHTFRRVVKPLTSTVRGWLETLVETQVCSQQPLAQSPAGPWLTSLPLSAPAPSTEGPLPACAATWHLGWLYQGFTETLDQVLRAAIFPEVLGCQKAAEIQDWPCLPHAFISWFLPACHGTWERSLEEEGTGKGLFWTWCELLKSHRQAFHSSGPHMRPYKCKLRSNWIPYYFCQMSLIFVMLLHELVFLENIQNHVHILAEIIIF